MEKPQKGLPAGRQGFTLIELLIAVAIIVLLSLFAFISLRGQSARATDIKRKADLYTLRKFFEEYNNDHEAFPAQSAVNDCGGAMEPYIKRIPCDPVSKTHYGYFPSANGGYRICAKLSDTTDPAIATMGCGGPLGCGLGNGYNYCLAAGVTASAVGTVDEVTSTPTPTPGVGFGCAPVDINGISYCNYYSSPTESGCKKIYSTGNCDDECQSHPEFRCEQ